MLIDDANISADGTIVAIGDEDFGKLTGERKGNAIFLHTSGQNDYEYWAIITVSSPTKLIFQYLGYGMILIRKVDLYCRYYY